MLARLERAKKGDEAAHAEVALYCFNKYKHRIARLYSLDPATDMEDLELTFFEAIMKVIPKLDHRGNPFYHAGQHGWWAVASELRRMKALINNRGQLRPNPENDTDWLERLENRLEPDFRDSVVTRLVARDSVKVVTGAKLKPPAMKALALIFLDQVGYTNEEGRWISLSPGDLGFNKYLAEQMECSPQRVSQLMNEIRDIGSDVLPWETP